MPRRTSILILYPTITCLELPSPAPVWMVLLLLSSSLPSQRTSLSRRDNLASNFAILPDGMTVTLLVFMTGFGTGRGRLLKFLYSDNFHLLTEASFILILCSLTVFSNSFSECSTSGLSWTTGSVSTWRSTSGISLVSSGASSYNPCLKSKDYESLIDELMPPDLLALFR